MKFTHQLVASLATVALAVCLPAVPANAAADVVPDKAFKGCINSELGRKSTASLTAAQLADVYYLDCEGNWTIKSLEGAQYLTEVDTLYLEGSFSNLTPLAGLNTLRYVRLFSDRISDLSVVSGWSQAEGIYVQGEFTNLAPLAGLTNLDELYLYGDFTSVSALASLTSLTTLGLGSDELSSLTGLGSLAGLKNFTLSDSLVTNLNSIASLANLESVALWSNESLTNISALSGKTNLESLMMSGNGVTNFSVLATLTNLRSLGLYDAGLSDATVVSALTGLENLDLSGNLITNLAPLAGLTKLEYLSVAYNLITDVSPLASLTSLAELAIYGNDISDISALSSLTALTWIDADEMSITDISALPSSLWEYFDSSCATSDGWSAIKNQSITQKAWTGTYDLPTVKTVPGGTIKWSVKSGSAKISGNKVKYSKAGTVKLAWKDKCGNFTGVVTVTVRTATFKMTFDANGGTTPKLGKKTYKSKNVTVGKTVGSVPESTHSTQVFAGWYTEPTGGTQVTADSVVDEDTPSKVYAHWTAPTSIAGLSNQQNSYVLKAPVSKAGTVTLNFPGGVTKTVNLSDKNVTLAGVDTSTTGTRLATVTVQPSGLTMGFGYTVEDGTITLDPQGGSVSATSVGFTYKGKLPKLPTPTRTGYSFKGWYTQPTSGGKKYASGKKATQTQSFTEYARWSAKSYTVKFNANGGKVSKKSKSVKYDSAYGALPTPTLKGMTFAGWWTDPAAGTKVEATDVFTFGATQTLYAHWS
ncbi:MAG: InlB B-repeat-containing protein [Propionibacteriaceae bacterium]|nr:InlB B-repeat-containing protein [Propionibacteriaceae bacterium]